jgi:hypothetical protein
MSDQHSGREGAEMNIRETLPVHPLNTQETRPGGEAGGLDVCGLVD